MPIDRREFLHAVAALGATAGLGASWPAPSPQTSMLTRRIPRTGEEIPVVGMGTWQTFDPPSPTPAVLDRLAEVLRVFIAGGGRVIDSSPMYGRSEEHTGALLQRLHATDSMFLATKVWTTGAGAGRRQLDTSSRLFHRTRLDLEQVHNLVDWRAQLDMLRAAKRDGRTRYVGITHYTSSSFDELEKIVKTERVDFVQLPYSVGFRAAESRLLPAAADSGTAVIVNEPFQAGRSPRRGARQAAARMGRAVRVVVGAVVSEIHHRASGRHVRHSRDRQSGSHARRRGRGSRADAGSRRAREAVARARGIESPQARRTHARCFTKP